MIIALRNVAMRATDQSVGGGRNNGKDLANHGCIIQANASAGKSEHQALLLSPEKAPVSRSPGLAGSRKLTLRWDVRAIEEDGPIQRS